MKDATIEVPDEVEALRSSPVHDLKPISEEPRWIGIDAVEIDPTNPGSVTQSMRYIRRAPSIRDSYDILGGIIYPIVVCQKDDDPGQFIHVDGFGRLEEMRGRGEERVRAIVFPPLTLEQRICLRQTLNAAQEPFDVVSVIHDLQELARQRGLDIRNLEHIRTLVRDLPDKVRKRQKDLEILARWDAAAVEKIGESYGTSTDSIGMDKIRGLTRILSAAGGCHPKTLERLGGEKAVSAILTRMYLAGKFSQGSRSQEAIRKVTNALLNIPSEDPLVGEFLENELDYRTLQSFFERGRKPGDIVNACKGLHDLLLDVDADSLTKAEVNALKRTVPVLQAVLG